MNEVDRQFSDHLREQILTHCDYGGNAEDYFSVAIHLSKIIQRSGLRINRHLTLETSYQVFVHFDHQLDDIRCALRHLNVRSVPEN